MPNELMPDPEIYTIASIELVPQGGWPIPVIGENIIDAVWWEVGE